MRTRAALLILLALSSATVSAHPPRKASGKRPQFALTMATAAGLSTAQLQHRLLPSYKDRFVAHDLLDAGLAAGALLHGIRFVGPATPIGSDLCGRTVVTVELEAIDPDAVSYRRPNGRDVPVKAWQRTRSGELVTAPHCALAKDSLFARVRWPQSAEDGAPAVRRFLALQALARSGEAAQLQISCVPDSSRIDYCTKPLAALFGDLRSDHLRMIDGSDRGGRYTLAGDDGGWDWQIDIGPGEGGRWSINLSRPVIPPF